MIPFLQYLRNRKRRSWFQKRIRKYLAGGRLPYTPGYKEYKLHLLETIFADPQIMEIFRSGKPLPDGFGDRVDERIVEYTWLLSRLENAPRLMLDAGSALNISVMLNTPAVQNRRLYIYTLAPESQTPSDHISYIYGDLRHTPFKDVYFDEIVSISTLEHVGMDNTKLYSKDESFNQNNPKDYLIVLSEMGRILKPAGRLFITVPFGRRQNLGWLQQFDRPMLDELIRPFSARNSEVTFYKYAAGGWQIARAAECSECTYFDIHARKDFDSDFAAAARAVACIEIS